VPPRACVCAWTTADRSTYRRCRRRRTSTQDTAYAKLYATYCCCQWAQLRCHGDGRLCTGVARILHWLLQKLSAKAFFRKKVDDLFSRRLQNFAVLNKAGPTSQQSQFFHKKIHSIDGWGTCPPLSPSGYDPGNAMQYAASVAIQRRSVCERCRSVSPPNDPSKNRPVSDRPTAALGHTSVETRISVN